MAAASVAPDSPVPEHACDVHGGGAVLWLKCVRKFAEGEIAKVSGHRGVQLLLKERASTCLKLLKEAEARLIELKPDSEDALACLQVAVMPVCRALACDDREFYEVRGRDIGTWFAPFAVSRWNEQIATKIARRFDNVQVLGCGECPQALTASFKVAFIEALCNEGVALFPPRQLPAASTNLSITSAPFLLEDTELLTSMRGTSAMTSPGPEGVASSVDNMESSGVSSSAQLPVSQYCTIVEAGPVASGDGKIILTSPVPPLTPIISVAFDDLFYINSVRDHCVLAEELLENWQSQCPDEETILLVCLIFEYFCIGVDKSHWEPMLRRLPTDFPTFPAMWSETQRMELVGTGVLELLQEKEAKLPIFSRDVHQLMSVVLLKLRGLPLGYQRTLAQFKLENVLWAKCVFDSRALHLNYNGTVKLTLAPHADMVNHADGTHILYRRIDMAEKCLHLETGSALGEDLVGSEMFFSYGPLQSFEMLMSYGFVPEEDNPYDRLPFPMSVDLNEECYVEGVDYRQLRMEIIKKFSLYSPDNNELWIPFSGQPPATLLAFIRLMQAGGDDYPALLENVFRTDLVQLEVAVLDTIEMVINAVVEQFPQTLQEDLAVLKLRRASAADTHLLSSPKSANAQTAHDHRSVSGQLAVRLRVKLLMVAKRTLDWCDAHRASLPPLKVRDGSAAAE